MVDEDRVCLNIDLRGDHARYLRKLQEMGFIMTQFVKEAMEYYIPTHAEKIKILLKYAEAIKKKQKFINEN